MPSQDQEAAIALNNKVRAQHGCPPLKWDDSLAEKATQWAEHLAKDVGHMQHSTGNERPGQGENLFWSWNSNKSEAHYEVGVQAWLNEAPKYQQGEKIGQGNFEAYGHYTQCLWKGTTHCGLGRAMDAKGGTYIVGRYSPEGNIVGQTPY